MNGGGLGRDVSERENEPPTDGEEEMKQRPVGGDAIDEVGAVGWGWGVRPVGDY